MIWKRAARKFTRCQISVQRVLGCNAIIINTDVRRERDGLGVRVCIKRSLITRYPKCELDANRGKVARGKFDSDEERTTRSVWGCLDGRDSLTSLTFLIYNCWFYLSSEAPALLLRVTIETTAK